VNFKWPKEKKQRKKLKRKQPERRKQPRRRKEDNLPQVNLLLFFIFC
jgi:hypothetical protein